MVEKSSTWDTVKCLKINLLTFEAKWNRSVRFIGLVDNKTYFHEPGIGYLWRNATAAVSYIVFEFSILDAEKDQIDDFSNFSH